MYLLRILLITLLLVTSAVAQSLSKTFIFGTPSGNNTDVIANDVYTTIRGYGFEAGAAITCSGTRRTSCSSNKPFYFSVALPEGTYRVSITFGDEKTETSTTIKAELRRLMLERVDTRPRQFVTKEFIVNVRTSQISTGGEVKLKDREKTSEWWAWDEKLTLEFNGARPTVSEITIERVDVPTLFLLGDSTVSDQPSEPYASWGQMLPRFFGRDVAVANHAESGESLRSSLGAKRLDKVLSVMRPGDYLLIQYGHNDEKEKGSGVGAFTTFKTDLKYLVEQTKKKGGIPVLITPVQRRTFDVNGKITNSHGDYPEAVRQTAKEENVPLIDLNATSKALYEALGKDESGRLFKDGDGTHHNNYGAYEIAKIIVQSIRDQRLSLARFLIKGLPKFDPKKPDAFESFAIPPSPMVTNLKPLGN